MRAAVKSLLLVACAGLVLTLGTAAHATAEVPCWQAVINDWYDGQIDEKYSPACYTAALHHLPRDVTDYSSAREDIKRALLASIRQGPGGGQPTSSSSAPPNSNGSGSGSRSRSQTGSSERSPKGAITRAIEWLGPSNAASVPLPLLVLAAVAFLLLAAAGGSFVNRRLQERRVPPAPRA
jgi:hypothetical protein